MNTQDKLLETNPTRYVIAGLLVIALFFGGLTVWAIYFPFQGAVIAPGTVRVYGERRVVQHLEGGIIDKILVRDGDLVKAGDLLIRLKSSKVKANVDILQGRMWAKQAEAARLRAEASMSKSVTWPKPLQDNSVHSELPSIKAMESDIFKSRKSDLDGKIHLYESQILQLGNQAQGAREELKSTQEIVANLTKDLSSKHGLLEKKYMGNSEILVLERQLAEAKGRVGRLKQDIAATQQRIQEFQLRIVDAKNEYRESAVSRLGEITDQIYEIQEQLKPELDARERLEVRAPVTGTVINIQVHTEGSGVIHSGMPLMEIVPKTQSLVIKAQVRPQDITNVRQGQKTKVNLSAFHRIGTPPINGKVEYVSPDLMTSKAQGGHTASYYEVHVKVDPEDLAAKGAYLSAGMPVACYITTDKRNIISYLLGPLLQNVDTALRE
nr:HlyD family type I secretion periplasmic adaptor subunit [uncultured Desulfobacter sp.]